MLNRVVQRLSEPEREKKASRMPNRKEVTIASFYHNVLG